MQTSTPERIFLCVPTRYERYSGAVEIPESLSRFGKRLQIVSCPEDYGPGTKLLGSENLVPRDPNSLLILGRAAEAYDVTAELDRINSLFAHNLAKLSLTRAMGHIADQLPNLLKPQTNRLP